MESKLKGLLGKLNLDESMGILFNTTKDIVNVSKDGFRDLFAKLSHEIEGLKPIIAQCGFVIKDISVTFPLPSEFKMAVEQTGRGKKTLEQIIEGDDAKTDDEHKLTDIQKTILNLMIKANELAVVTNQYGYTFKKYDVVFSVTPKVTLHLVSNKPME